MDASTPAPPLMRRLALPGAALLMLAASLPAVAAAAAPEPGARDIAAVFPPWWTPGRALSAAASAGQVRAAGSGSHILIVHADAREADGGLAARLRASGAILLLAPQGRSGCTPDARSPAGTP